MSTWIFLRGLSRESRHWGDFIENFRHRIPEADIITLDLPGNGCLSHLPSLTRVEAMAAWCRAELTARAVRPPYYLLGMSLGAMVAIAWASGSADEIGGCILINTSLRPFNPFYQRLRPRNYASLLKLALFGGSDETREKTILRLTSNRSGDNARLLARWADWRREQTVSRFNALRQLLAAARYRAPAKQLKPPLLILASVEDKLVNPICSWQLAVRWDASYAEHLRAGHDIPLDDGAWVAHQVEIWLRDKQAV
ncbi:MAG: alpha/beta hydrolase [Sterolibacterium sp.]